MQHLRWSTVLIFSSVWLASAACQENEIQNNRAKTSSIERISGDANGSKTGPAFLMHWNPSATAVSTYHVFYAGKSATNVAGAEIDSINSNEHDLSKPEIVINDSNLSPMPSTGSQICFYIVAENAAGKSDPSDAACTTM